MKNILLISLIIIISLWLIPTLSPQKNQTANTVVSNTPIATTTTNISQRPTATTTAAKVKTDTAKPKSTAVKKVATTTPSIKKQLVEEPQPDFEAINTSSRKAIVNILCQTKSGVLSPISGTGVVISPEGLILTNAHIGQYLLLKDYTQKDFVECIARTGSPAYPTYHLELVYISSTWIENNRDVIKQTSPKGTGENDFAILHITDRIDKSSLPPSLPYIIPNIREKISVSEPVLLVSYPAGFLGGLSILQNLNITSAITLIQEVFTFKETTIDLISVGGTVVSQKGASGGAVVDKNSTLIGLISTSSEEDNTSQRDLRAITLAHINRTLYSELGINLTQFLSQDTSSFTKSFQDKTAPLLTKILEDELNN